MWSKIVDFNGYEVSNSGQIKNSSTGRILKHSFNSKGYAQISIKGKCRKVHRLVAIAFIPNKHGLETINHKNGIKNDNRVENLEWISRSENVKHSIEILKLKRKPYSKSKSKNHLIGRTGFSSNAGKPVKAIFEDLTEIVYGSSYEAAKELFGRIELGKQIRKYISLGKKYKSIKFMDYGK